MDRPEGSQRKGPSKGDNLEKLIKFGIYHLELEKHPENIYRVHPIIDSNYIFGY